MKLRAGKSFEAYLYTRRDRTWISGGAIDLPSKETGASLNSLVYDESRSSISPSLAPTSSPTSSSWSMIHIPSGFDVIDVVLVDSSRSAKIYGIQITRSVKPFAKHHTFNTCPQRSKDRLQKLWRVIAGHYQQEFEAVYVMRAPNCEGSAFKARKGQKVACYFAPGISVG